MIANYLCSLLSISNHNIGCHQNRETRFEQQHAIIKIKKSGVEYSHDFFELREGKYWNSSNFKIHFIFLNSKVNNKFYEAITTSSDPRNKLEFFIHICEQLLHPRINKYAVEGPE